MGERVLYLVRHGQLDRAAKNQFAAGLTALGREQARVTAKRLHPMDVSAIYCSTLGRARETAEIIHAAFPTVALWNSTLLWELGNVGPPDDHRWQTGFARGQQRGARAFARYVRPSRTTERIDILVTHGNLVRYFVCRVLGIPPESWSTLATSHCGITQLRVAPDGGVRLGCYNDTGHLPARLRS